MSRPTAYLHELPRRLGSLRLAVVLLPLFAVTLLLGALVESRHDARTAQHLVYQTWWFLLVLTLLGVNILCAAVKKWPWRWSHTGFLITHLGLLTLVAGGLASSVSGVSGRMVLVDSDDARFTSFGPRTSAVLVEEPTETIRVRRATGSGPDLLRTAFNPGTLAWDSEQPVNNGLWTAWLDWLAHPLPRRWARELSDGSRLEVLASYPHARLRPFSPAGPETMGTFPAVRFRLSSPTTGALPPRWLAFDREATTARTRLGPGLVEFLARLYTPGQMREFHTPPRPDQAGSKGQLVLGLGAVVYRFDVDRLLGRTAEPLGQSGWSVYLREYLANFQQPSDSTPSDPGLSFELSREGISRLGFALTARQPGELFPLVEYRSAARPPELWAWYHPPDPRYGDGTLRAVLQFATDAEGRLCYRSFSGAGDETRTGIAFERSGTLEANGERQRIWAGMGWKLQVLDFIPHATAEPSFEPAGRGGQSDDVPAAAALRCRLTRRGEVRDFCLGKTETGLTPITLGGETYLVGCNATLRELDFRLTLLRAEQTTDLGSSRPANQSSHLLVHGPPGTAPIQAVVTLNQPLVHRGWKFYQSGYASLGQDASGKPVSQALLTASYDPGVYLKYAGSAMVALGIVCMFTMRSYFFRTSSG